MPQLTTLVFLVAVTGLMSGGASVHGAPPLTTHTRDHLTLRLPRRLAFPRVRLGCFGPDCHYDHRRDDPRDDDNRRGKRDAVCNKTEDLSYGSAFLINFFENTQAYVSFGSDMWLDQLVGMVLVGIGVVLEYIQESSVIFDFGLPHWQTVEYMWYLVDGIAAFLSALVENCYLPNVPPFTDLMPIECQGEMIITEQSSTAPPLAPQAKNRPNGC